MKKNNCLQRSTRDQLSQPVVGIFPQRTVMYIGYGKNDIFVSLSAPLPSDFMMEVIDITDKPLSFKCKGMSIRNGVHHNRIVASYHSDIRQIIILHFKRIYSVILPDTVKEIYCGGRAHRIPKADIA